jgi:hypothetical protein
MRDRLAFGARLTGPGAVPLGDSDIVAAAVRHDARVDPVIVHLLLG